MGRPTKLTPETQATIVERIEAGGYDWVAAQSAGIDPSTFRRWMHAGQRGSPLYRAFCAEVSKARATARLKAEIKVRVDAPFNWLRYGPGRERPGEPGWTESHEITGPHGGAVQFLDITKLTDEELETLDRFVAKAGRKPRGDPPRVRPPAS